MDYINGCIMLGLHFEFSIWVGSFFTIDLVPTNIPLVFLTLILYFLPLHQFATLFKSFFNCICAVNTSGALCISSVDRVGL